MAHQTVHLLLGLQTVLVFAKFFDFSMLCNLAISRWRTFLRIASYQSVIGADFARVRAAGTDTMCSVSAILVALSVLCIFVGRLFSSCK